MTGLQPLPHQIDRVRWQALEDARHIARKADSCQVILEQELGGDLEPRYLPIVRRWVDDLISDIHAFRAKLGAIPE